MQLVVGSVLYLSLKSGIVIRATIEGLFYIKIFFHFVYSNLMHLFLLLLNLNLKN